MAALRRCSASWATSRYRSTYSTVQYIHIVHTHTHSFSFWISVFYPIPEKDGKPPWVHESCTALHTLLCMTFHIPTYAYNNKYMQILRYNADCPTQLHSQLFLISLLLKCSNYNRLATVFCLILCGIYVLLSPCWFCVLNIATGM